MKPLPGGLQYADVLLKKGVESEEATMFVKKTTTTTNKGNKTNQKKVSHGAQKVKLSFQRRVGDGASMLWLHSQN